MPPGAPTRCSRREFRGIQCGGIDSGPEYYTTVDVLVVDGEPKHDWSSPVQPVNPNDAWVKTFYNGEERNSLYRWYEDRKSLAFTIGFGVNGTRGDETCEPRLSSKVRGP